MADQAEPRAEYTRRLAYRQAVAARQARLDGRASDARLAIVLVTAVMALLAFWAHALSAWWLTAPVVVFLAIVVLHARVIRARSRADRSVSFYQRGLARLDNQWAGSGVSGDRLHDETHPYAADLDLFGRGSLFELLCAARTSAGEETLGAWLRAPATPEEVFARQAAVRELAPKLDLREELALLGDDVRAGVHPETLAAWGTAPAMLSSAAVRAAAAVLAVAAVATLGLWVAGVSGPIPFAVVIVADLALALPVRARVIHVIHVADVPSDELELLSHLLARFEGESFASPLLIALRADLNTNGAPPSQRIATLRRLIDLLDARRNQLFMPISFLLLWGTQFAHAIEAWRAVSGAAVPRWFAAVGKLEALCSLAGYAWENPEDCYPVVVDSDRGAVFDGEGLGHPLLPRATNVRNDVHLVGRGQNGGPSALVVSGSNMSGKSTLLRTVGVSTVMALAGSPVRAQRLRLTPLAVGATLRIEDSLQAGTSRFYAEITRLRAIVELVAGPLPPLFLLDELLNGTNSHDRRIGAEALVRGLIERGAVGLVTTHDLALAEIADALAPSAANVHFEDCLEEGRMSFDYRCRPGVVTRSNALALMRAVGLEL